MPIKTTIFILLALLVLIIGASFVLAGDQKPQSSIKSYQTQDKDRPKVEAKTSFFDFGEIKLSDTKIKDFPIKNTGNKPLDIFNVSSSCSCTSGQIIYKDFQSKEFGMHSEGGFVTQIKPGETATVRVVYRPAIMPVYGLIEREVYVETNDPSNQKLVFSIKAKVK